MKQVAGIVGIPVFLLLALVMAATIGSASNSDPPTGAQAASCQLLAPGDPNTPLDGGDRLDADQLANAAIIVGVAQTLHLPAQAAVVALATAKQEADLHNPTVATDHDSLGLFQQRPSQGWGTPAQVTDPVYATQAFYEHLIKIPGWQTMPVTQAAAAVQRPRADLAGAYARWEPLARALTAALYQHGAAHVTCTDPTPGIRAGQKPRAEQCSVHLPGGCLTPRTYTVMQLIRTQFGEHDIGGFNDGTHTGHINASDHYTGHAIDVMLLPYTDPARIAKGMQIVQYLLANRDTYAIKYLIYQRTYWGPEDDWRPVPYHHPGGGDDDPDLAHLTHVHVSVL